MSKINIELIKEKADLAEYIMTYYPQIGLRRTGGIYHACCPFHEEDTPSLIVWTNGTWKCFGCGEHGDVITFVMKIEHLNFKEACKMIGDNVGVAVTLEPPNPHHEKYKDMMTEHNRRYWRVLQTNQDALHYLRNVRGLTDETIAQFRLGLVPNDEYKYRNDIGGIANRLVFPILEHKDANTAKCLGMGYRTLKDEKPKYINDINQEGRPAYDKKPAQDPNLAGVFIKGNCLYGYPFAYQEIRKANYAILTEGYVDVISMHQAGIKNTVACMGTAITENQADILRKLTSNLLLFLDGDSAGIENMIKVLPMLIEKGFNVKILIAENGMDAADVCLKCKFNRDYMQAYITSHSKPAINVVIDRAVNEYEQVVVRERIKAMNTIAPLLEKIPSEYEKDIFKSMAYKRLDLAGV